MTQPLSSTPDPSGRSPFDGRTPTDDPLARAREALAEAPFDRLRWRDALRLLAEAGGGWATQLIGLSPDNAILFHHAWGLPQESVQEFERRGGVNPAVNLRARLLSARPMTVLGDDRLASPEEWEANDFYRAFLKPLGAPFCAGARLSDHSGGPVILKVARSEAQGPAQPADIAALQSVLEQLSRAVQTQQRLEDHGLLFAVGAFEAAGIAALICDGHGRAIAATPSAQARLAQGCAVTVRRGRIVTADGEENERLQAALRRATHPDGDGRVTAGVMRLGGLGGEALVLDIAPLPRLDFSMGLNRGCVVLFGSRADLRSTDLLMSAFSVSRAEAEVAVRLADGADIRDLAADRGVSVATIRNQRKALFSKIGVNSRAELTAKITPVIWRK